MTPDEHQLITGLFDRMRGLGYVEKDRDADALISQSIRQLPDAAYLLVQSVLVQEQALANADARLRELEAQVDELKRGGTQPAQSSGGRFLGLGGLLGGGSGAGVGEGGRRTSVPPIGDREAMRRAPGDDREKLRAPAEPPPQRGGGVGGFLGSALATAAGVTGGMLLADSIRGLFGGEAHAGTHGHDGPAAAGQVTHEAATQRQPSYQDPNNNDPGVTHHDAQDVDDDDGDFDFGGDSMDA